MINKKYLLLVTVLLVSLFSINLPVHGQSSIFDTSASSLFNNEDEFLKPEQAFVFNFDQNNSTLLLSFDIVEGYYLYKKQFKFTGDGVSFEPVELPNGIDHEDEFFGKQQIYVGPLTLTVPLTQVSSNGKIHIRYQGCAEAGLCFPPIIKTLALSPINSTANSVLSALGQTPQADKNHSSTLTTNSKTTQKSEQYQLVELLKGNNLTLTLVAFFIGGLLLSFTPCVFPMYPILTGIIVGQKDSLSTKKAFSLSFVYVQGMAITYTFLGVVVALAGAQFQAMFQHPIVLISLSVLFILLALSMFGIFNLALPSSWQNKLNQLSNKQQGGSYFGVLAMGAISGLVASPCTTAPLTGALLYISQSGDLLLGGLALYTLSLGMGLPLLVLGSSGGKLLPKAGNWMNVIKNIFGLLLLAVPIFLLERFLPDVVSKMLWIALLLGSASYFYVANQGTKANFWFGVRSLVIFLMLFFGANQAYQLIYPSTQNSLADTEHSEMFLKVANLAELQQRVKLANNEGKTVMVDLYADWCIACKEFEKYTFPKPQVQQALANTVLLQMDLTDMGKPENKVIMQEFDIFGLPSILFFDLNGKELSQQRVTGFMGAQEFARHIQQIF